MVYRIDFQVILFEFDKLCGRDDLSFIANGLDIDA